MQLTAGLEQYRNRVNRQLSSELSTLKAEFDKIKDDLTNYVKASGGALKLLKSFSIKDDIPNREHEPEGFLYGLEKIPSLSSQQEIIFPLLYSFDKVNATAIEESSEYLPFFFNAALRAIISYPLGDSIVYLLDSNVSGDFNSLSPISTDLNDLDSKKNMFHYITTDDDKNNLFTELASVMDKNIKNYVSQYPSISAYNKANPIMHAPYHFLFIRNIEEALHDKQQVDKLIRLVHAQNATKAGIYIFYTFNKDKLSEQIDSYFSDSYKAINNLLNISTILETPKRHYVDSELILEPKATSEIVAKVINYVEIHEVPKTVMTFKKEIQQQLSKGTLWNPPFERKSNHLYFPVGYQNAVTKKEIDVSFSGTSPHFFIGGTTGSGKSILLHNLILNGALRYSPDQLQFYLVDMKGGVSFASYKQLPHVAALSASSSRHYAESLLELFYDEIERRALLFKRERATSLSSYNDAIAKDGKAGLPYMFGIIDEFQVLVTETDSISSHSVHLIESIHRLGRSQGVFLALCTQSPPSNISRSQIGIKMSLNCPPGDSTKLIGNEGAARLRGVGRAIVNTSVGGEEKYNQEFQVAYVDETKELPLYIKQIRDIYLKQNNGVDKFDHMIYDDNDLETKLSDNPVLMQPDTQKGSRTPFIYIGAPGFYRKEHVKFCFHRDSLSNVAICGSDRQSALRLVGIITLQFIGFYKEFGAKVYICDLQKQLESTYNKLEFLAQSPNIKHGGAANLKDMIEEAYNMLSARKQDRANSVFEAEVLFTILDIKPDENFSSGKASTFSFSGTTEKTPMSMLKELIEDGPNFGIHVMVYGFNYTNMEFLQNQYLLNYMEIKIALRGGNSSRLLISYGSQDTILKGQGFVKMPVEMGRKYNNDKDSLGDPFLIYDTLGNEKLRGTAWDTLFTNLPNAVLNAR